MREFVVEADGGSRGNPGPAGYGAVVRDAVTGRALVEVAEYLGVVTNNVAEYRGLVAALEAARDLDPEASVHVRMDSKLVVEQMTGRWQIKHPAMRPLATRARAVLAPERVTYEWIPRAQNKHADRLANEAMDAGELEGVRYFARREVEGVEAEEVTTARGAIEVGGASGVGAAAEVGGASGVGAAADGVCAAANARAVAGVRAATGVPAATGVRAATDVRAAADAPAASGVRAATGENAASDTRATTGELAATDVRASAEVRAGSHLRAATGEVAASGVCAATGVPAAADEPAASDVRAAATPRTASDIRAAKNLAPDLGAPTTFVLLRHGETALTPERRFSGSGGSDPALSEVGRVQAELVGDALAVRGTVEVIVTSPLARCRETARAVADRLGLDVAVEQGLRETDFGSWEGLTFGEVRERHPADLDAWLASAGAQPSGGGESFTAVAHRVAAARDELLASYAGRTVLLVSHVTPIKTLVRLALGAPPESLFRMELSAASLSAIAYYTDGNASLRLLNDTNHLR